MQHIFIRGVSALALLVSAGFAVAQQPPTIQPAQQPQTQSQPPQSQPSERPVTEGPAAPASGKDDAQAERALHTKSGKAGKDEPGAHVDSAKSENSPVLVDGRLNVPGAKQDSQTVPSKFSERNARLDTIPIMAQPLALSAEERRQIFESVKKANAPVASVDAGPAQELPAAVTLYDLPLDIAKDIASLRDRNLKYVRLDDRLLIVSPASRIVIGEVRR